MPYRSLQQLRDEQQVHHRRAMQLLREASEIFQEMRYTADLEKSTRLRKQWLEKDAQARIEIDKSIELLNQFIQELERLKNRNLN